MNKTLGEHDNMMNEDTSKGLEKYEIENHIRTLHDAEKIKGDEALMKELRPHIEKHKASAGKITSIEQLKAVAKKKIAEIDQE